MGESKVVFGDCQIFHHISYLVYFDLNGASTLLICAQKFWFCFGEQPCLLITQPVNIARPKLGRVLKTTFLHFAKNFSKPLVSHFAEDDGDADDG